MSDSFDVIVVGAGVIGCATAWELAKAGARVAVVFIFSLLSALYPALRLHWLHPVAAMRAA